MDAAYLQPPTTEDRTRTRWRALLLPCAALAGFVLLHYVNPVESSFFPRCVFNLATGLYCPGCGATRALYQLAHGHLAAALAMNPLLVLSMPFVVYYLLSSALLALRGRGLPKLLVHPAILHALFWLVIAFGILRNIPLYPFNLLAPHTL